MRVFALALGFFLAQCRTVPVAPSPSAEAQVVETPAVQQEAVALTKAEWKTKKSYCDEWSQVVCASDNTSIYAPHLCSIEIESGVGPEMPNPQVYRGDNYCQLLSDLSQNFCHSDKLVDSTPLDVSCAPDATQGECPLNPTVCESEDSAPNSQACEITSYDGNVLPDTYRLSVQGNIVCAMKVALYQQACALNLRPSLLGTPVCTESSK